MSRPDNSRRGPYALGDGTGGTSTSTGAIELNKTAGPMGIKFLFGDITSLTGTLSASLDGTNFFPLASWTDAGVYYAKSATITAVDGMSLYFVIGGYNYVKFTRTAGSGPIYDVQLASADEAIAALLIVLSAGSGFSVTPVTAFAEDTAHVTADKGDFILAVRNDTLLTPTNTDGDYSQISVDKRGRIMVGGVPRELVASQRTTISASTAETTVVTAIASTFCDLCVVLVRNKSGTAANVTFRDSTAGTQRFDLAVPAGETRGYGEGFVPWPQAAVNNNWTAQSDTSVTDLVVSVLYLKNI